MKRQAFTLFEMLLSVAIIAILTGIMTPIFLSFQARNDVDIAAMALVQGLRRAEQLSRNGEGDSTWGVNLASGAITIFKGTTFATRDISSDEIFSIPSTISFAGIGTSTLVFGKLYGLPTASSTITLISINNETRTVNVNPKGSVELAGVAISTSGAGPSFTCGTPVVVTSTAEHVCSEVSPSFDTCTYNTVQIGPQCWMKQNINVGTRISGTSAYQTNNSLLEKFCYSDNSANCQPYGGLYEFNEMVQYSGAEGARGICPTGWHVPTDAEWSTLISYLTTNGYSGTEGNALKASPATWDGNNAFNFTGLPNGYLSSSWTYTGLTTVAYFRSSTLNGGSNTWDRTLGSGVVTVNRLSDTLTTGVSVRCLMD